MPKGTLSNVSGITSFTASWNVRKLANSNTGAYFNVGASSSDKTTFGQGGQNKIVYTPPWTEQSVNIGTNVDTEMVLTYTGSVFTLTCNSVSLSYSKVYASLDYWNIDYESNNSISDLLIMPL